MDADTDAGELGQPSGGATRLSDPRMARLSRAYLWAGALLTVIYFLVPPEPAKLIVWPILGWSSVVAIVVGATANRCAPRRAWVLLAAGVGTLIVGDDLYSFRNFVQHEEALFPSYVDVVYLAMYPLLVAGLGLLLRHSSDGRHGEDRIIDAAIITVGLGLLSWVLLIVPHVRADELGTLAKLTAIAYPVGDVALLALAAGLVIGRESRRALWLLTIGLVALLSGDALYGYFSLAGSYTEHSLIDLGWIVFYLAWGAAALDPSVRGLGAAPRLPRATTRGRWIAIGSATLVPPITLFAQDLRGEVTDARAIALAGAVLFALVLARVARLAIATADERSERRLRALFDHALDAILVVDRDGTISYHSPSAERLVGKRAALVDGARLGDLIDDAQQVELADLVADGSTPVSLEWRARDQDGRWHDLEVVVADMLGTPDVGGYVLTIRDVSERKALDLQLRRQALHDTLTGLPNRALFLDRLAQALRRADRHGTNVGILYLDLDDFKGVNDSLGHAVGDRLLDAVSRRLVDSMRAGDTVARFGGDEFAILLENGDTRDGLELAANRIRAALRAPFAVGEVLTPVRASIGMAIAAPSTHQPDDVLRDADLAMYVAKRKGKDRIEHFAPAMHAEATHRHEVFTELEGAIDRHELVLHYQPIVDLRTGQTRGVEALVRWLHPSWGLLAPSEFVPIAETTGLIAALDQWVLAEACRQAATWRRMGATAESFYVSVNLSARHLREEGVAEDILSATRASGLPPRSLVLEVTETALIEDLVPAGAALRELKALGVRVAVDDFGTGYSSLAHLRSFPVDLIKIDKSFVDGVVDDPESRVVVRTVLGLASSLGLAAVAEGVEEEPQRAALLALGCELAQGYLFSRPIPAADMGRLLHWTAVRPAIEEVAVAP